MNMFRRQHVGRLAEVSSKILYMVYVDLNCILAEPPYFHNFSHLNSCVLFHTITPPKFSIVYNTILEW